MRDAGRYERGLPSIARSSGLTTGTFDRTTTYTQHRDAPYARPLSPTLQPHRDTSNYTLARPVSPTLQHKYTDEVCSHVATWFNVWRQTFKCLQLIFCFFFYSFKTNYAITETKSLEKKRSSLNSPRKIRQPWFLRPSYFFLFNIQQ